jgi:glyceraldehyde-3-phosphate dehydrogenase/erythrose-4-phosphate dehydrogenase
MATVLGWLGEKMHWGAHAIAVTHESAINLKLVLDEAAEAEGVKKKIDQSEATTYLSGLDTWLYQYKDKYVSYARTKMATQLRHSLKGRH